MGNLPRSRPGRRSEKRTGAGASPGGPAKSAAPKARATSAKAAPRSSAKKAPRSPARPAAARPAPARGSRPDSTARGPDPIGDAARVAAKVAGAGLGLAANVLKRLPRP
jgi:hypothetical protein